MAIASSYFRHHNGYHITPLDATGARSHPENTAAAVVKFYRLPVELFDEMQVTRDLSFSYRSSRQMPRLKKAGG